MTNAELYKFEKQLMEEFKQKLLEKKWCKFEYKTTIDNDACLDRTLDKYGREGWELVSVFQQPNPSYYRLFFKRKVLE